MISTLAINTTNLNLYIYGLVNFVQQYNFTIKTMKYLKNNNNNIVKSSLSSSPITK